MPPIDPLLRMPSTLIGKRDYGIKIAKVGYDVNYSSDTDLLYNSSFPVLAIVKTIGSIADGEILQDGYISKWNEYTGKMQDYWIFTLRTAHGLNYTPMVVDVNKPLYDYNYNAQIETSWDSKYVYIDMSFNTVGDYNTFVSGGKKLRPVMVLAVNIEKDIEYPYLDFGGLPEWGVADDYGLKYILNGDKDNLNLADLGINPNIQSLMVTAVKVTEDPTKVIYEPTGISVRNLSAFCFVRAGGRWKVGGVSVQAVGGYRPYFTGDTGYYRIDGLFFADKVSLVVVRMPFIAPDKLTYNVNM